MLCNLAIHEVNDLSGERNQAGMMGRELALQRQLKRRKFPPQPPSGEGGKHLRIPFPGHEGRQHPTPTHPEQLRDHTRQLDIGILEAFVHAVLGLTPTLD
jgi:hypothetical protein